jgi:predicted Rossmann-fold nucleotide-binding protein
VRHFSDRADGPFVRAAASRLASGALAVRVGQVPAEPDSAISELPETPYQPFRDRLYSREELMEGWSPGKTHEATLDARIYAEFARYLKHPDRGQALAQRIHDYSIDQALGEFIADRRDRLVGIMGGSSASLTKPETADDYRHAAVVAWRLAQADYLVVSGGGLGIMEAANLGAALADKPRHELNRALDELSQVDYKADQAAYLEVATAIRERNDPVHPSLAVPTWLYPGEPISQFATDIAKYFANSIREDGLLAICLAGVVYCPGRSGTTQEIFQDAAQNAYTAFGVRSPMVMTGSEYFAETGLYAVLRDQARRNAVGESYQHLVALIEDAEAIVSFIEANRPVSPAPVEEAAAGVELVQTLRTAFRMEV